MHNPDRTLHRCLADVQSPSGTLRVHNFPDGQWAVSVPALGLPRGSKNLAAFSLAGLVAPTVEVTIDAGGQRGSAPLNAQWTDAFRRGGPLVVVMKGVGLTWLITDAGATMGAVQECVVRYRQPAPVPAPVAVAPAGRWSICATENLQICQFAGTRTVRYGAGQTWVVRQFAGSMECSPASFGGDPVPNVRKTCEVLEPAQQAAAVTPRAQALVQPQPQAQTKPSIMPLAAGSEPVALIETLYREGGKSLRKATTSERFLSRRLVQLIAEDERKSVRAKEPGNIEFDLLTGQQDLVKFADVRVTEVARQQDRATVRVSFRNVAFSPPPQVAVTFELQNDRGWRITDIKYAPDHTLLGSLTATTP